MRCFQKQFSESSYLSLALKFEGLESPVAQRTCSCTMLRLGQALNSDSSLLVSVGSRIQHVNYTVAHTYNTSTQEAEVGGFRV